ncbi:hypothetical protein [Pseudomonas sp. FEN]|uniref:hypothetical protein n=1 Tax=Pseudomonas sp. FEN TaxID=2767468 RepID=UPI00174A6644|nr:hypothetical protein [Pseudomonas sp. FEN]
MEKNYSVMYKFVGVGADYIYQQDKNAHKACGFHDSPGGHMWYGVSDGVARKIIFDFSLRTPSQSLSYGSTLMALLNSGDVRARLTLLTKYELKKG